MWRTYLVMFLWLFIFFLSGLYAAKYVRLYNKCKVANAKQRSRINDLEHENYDLRCKIEGKWTNVATRMPPKGEQVLVRYVKHLIPDKCLAFSTIFGYGVTSYEGELLWTYKTYIVCGWMPIAKEKDNE